MQPRSWSWGKRIDVASGHTEETAPGVYKLINLAVRAKKKIVAEAVLNGRWAEDIKKTINIYTFMQVLSL
jgi:hypothetical protein